ncbi:MAG: serine hydrolase [Oligoflexia bacterium]|nr:serine hydrolase [Oligoflexia bacterium]MBF0366707.1 serine hydrolase [Oligoflexia bacterium]
MELKFNFFLKSYSRALPFLIAMIMITVIATPKLALAETVFCKNFAKEFLAMADRNPSRSRGLGHDNDASSDTFAIADRDRLLYEWYDKFHNEQSKHSAWSVTKTVTALLVGVAVMEGRLTLDTKVESIVPLNPELIPDNDNENENKNENYEANYSQLTIRDLLTMSSGFDWRENGVDPIWNLSILRMLYLTRTKDAGQEVLSHPFVKKRWNYSSGDFVLLALILKKIYKHQPRYPWVLLFDPLHMDSVTFEQDATGTYLGGSGLFLSTRDMLKLGQLILKRGVWEGKQVVPEWWINFMGSVSVSAGDIDNKYWSSGVYGGGLWTNHSLPSLSPRLPSMPSSTLLATGIAGQYLVILPEYDLVVVRTGHDQLHEVNIDQLVKSSVDCFGKRAHSTEREAPRDQADESINSMLASRPTAAKEALFAIKSGLLTKMMAKELCSCHFVVGLPLHECRLRSIFPPALSKIVKTVKVTDYSRGEALPIYKIKIAPTVLSYLTIVAKSPAAYARYYPEDPEKGCHLWR